MRKERGTVRRSWARSRRKTIKTVTGEEEKNTVKKDVVKELHYFIFCSTYI